MAMQWAGNASRLKVTSIPLHAQLLTRLRSRRTLATWSLTGLHALSSWRAWSIVRELDYNVGAADVDRILAWLAVAVASFVVLAVRSRSRKGPRQ